MTNRYFRGVLVVSIAVAFAPLAWAAEDDIKLAPDPNLTVVEQNCAGCHSLDYILMNSPILDQAGWQAAVTKMVNAFKAPIAEADQQVIVAYLAAHYAK
jgi:hypothetical protein